jgi:predicted nucleotidyltransferase
MEHNLIIEEIKHYLIDKYKCHLIILYGSYASEDHRKESDVDLICFSDINYSENDTSIQYGLQLDAWIYNSDSMRDIENFIHITDGKIIYDKLNLGNGFLDLIKQTYVKGPAKLDKKQIQFLKDWLYKMLKRSKKNDPEGNYRLHWLLKDSLEIYFNIKGLWFLGSKKSLNWLEINDNKTYELFISAFDRNAHLLDIEKLIDYIIEL